MSRKCNCILAGDIEVGYSGNINAEIVVVGESPGELECRKGQPFVGRSGDLNKECFKAARIPWHKVFLMNSGRCMIRTDELTDREIRSIVTACRPKLEKAIKHIKPKVIITQGKWAYFQVLKKKVSIKKMRGLWQWSDEFDCWVMPTFHPAFILRNMGLKPLLLSDIAQVSEFKLRGFQHKQKEDDSLKWREASSIRPLLELDEPSFRSLDTETLGLDWKKSPPIILCYSVGIKTGRAVTIRLFEECKKKKNSNVVVQVKRIPEGKKKPILTDVFVRKCPDFDQKVAELIEFCERSDIHKAMQHGSFDIHFIREFVKHWANRDLTFKGWYIDTQAAAHVLDENLFELAPLELLQAHLTDFDSDYWRIFSNKYSKEDMLSVPREELVKYACGDADVTYRVAKEIIARLKQEKGLLRYYTKLVHPALKVLLEMEKNGVKVDQKALPRIQTEIKAEVDKLQTQALALVPDDVLRKHKKKGLKLTRKQEFIPDIMFSETGFHVSTKGLKAKKGGGPKFDKEARKTLLERPIPKKAKKFIKLFEKWSTWYTLLTRYLSGFKKHIKNDGRIHTSYSLAKTVTGRSSSSNPNMQNNPKHTKEAQKIRELLEAESGYKLLAVDMAQSELKWIAHVAKEKNMIRIFAEGRDIHRETAEMIKNRKLDGMTKDEISEARFHAKALNFGGIYGISPMGFRQNAWLKYGIKLTDRQAADWLHKLLDIKYPLLRRYHADTVRECQVKGYVTSPFGRRRRLPEIHSSDITVRNKAEREAINSKIQSPSSDVVLKAAANLNDSGELDPRECRIIAFVHDELVFEVKDDKNLIRKYYRAIKHALENVDFNEFGFDMTVPLTCDAKIGKNLANMEELEDVHVSKSNKRRSGGNSDNRK